MNTQIDIIKNGTTTLATAGKYCDRNIDVNVSYTKCFDGSMVGEYIDDNLTSVRFGGFAGTGYTKISLPNCTELKGTRNFAACPNLEVLELPEVVTTTEGLGYTFYASTKLKKVSLPKLAYTSDTGGCFQGCSNIERIELPMLSGTTISNYTFRQCYALKVIIIGGSTLCPLGNVNAFQNCNNAIIYVPDDLVTTYQGATNWATYASRIKGISEVPKEDE